MPSALASASLHNATLSCISPGTSQCTEGRESGCLTRTGKVAPGTTEVRSGYCPDINTSKLFKRTSPLNIDSLFTQIVKAESFALKDIKTFLKKGDIPKKITDSSDRIKFVELSTKYDLLMRARDRKEKYTFLEEMSVLTGVRGVATKHPSGQLDDGLMECARQLQAATPENFRELYQKFMQAPVKRALVNHVDAAMLMQLNAALRADGVSEADCDQELAKYMQDGDLTSGRIIKAPAKPGHFYNLVFQLTWAQDTELQLCRIDNDLERLAAGTEEELGARLAELKGYTEETLQASQLIPRFQTWEGDCDGNESPTLETFTNRTFQNQAFMEKYYSVAIKLGLTELRRSDDIVVFRRALFDSIRAKIADPKTDLATKVKLTYLQKVVEKNGYDTTMHARQDGEVQSEVCRAMEADGAGALTEVALAVLKPAATTVSLSEPQLAKLSGSPKADNNFKIVSSAAFARNILSNAGRSPDPEDLLREILGAVASMKSQLEGMRHPAWNPTPIFLVERPEDMASFVAKLSQLFANKEYGQLLKDFFGEYGLQVMCGPSDNGRQKGHMNVHHDLKEFVLDVALFGQENGIPVKFYPGWGNSSHRACIGPSDDPMSRLKTLVAIFSDIGEVGDMTVQGGSNRHLVFGSEQETLVELLVNSADCETVLADLMIEKSKTRKTKDEKRVIEGLIQQVKRKQQQQEKLKGPSSSKGSPDVLVLRKEQLSDFKGGLQVNAREDAYADALYSDCFEYDALCETLKQPENLRGIALYKRIEASEKRIGVDGYTLAHHYECIDGIDDSEWSETNVTKQDFLTSLKGSVALFQGIEDLQPGDKWNGPSIRAKARKAIQNMQSIRAIGFSGLSINSGMFLGASLSANGIKNVDTYVETLLGGLKDESHSCHESALLEYELLTEAFHGVDVDYLNDRLKEINEALKTTDYRLKQLMLEKQKSLIGSVLKGHEIIKTIHATIKGNLKTRGCCCSSGSGLISKSEGKILKLKLDNIDKEHQARQTRYKNIRRQMYAVKQELQMVKDQQVALLEKHLNLLGAQIDAK